MISQAPAPASETAPALMSAFLNDPGTRGERPEPVTPGASLARFLIPGLPSRGAFDAFKPGSVEFQATHLTVILSRTYDLWENYFGSAFDWEPGSALTVVPRAGLDLNAYYDRRSLKFFYYTNPATRSTIYSCESADVASHECGHAVLDAHHPDYWNSLHPETAAFHEAFGDISALLVTLQFESVRARWLKETGGNLRESNSISRLAEQLGKAIHDELGSKASSALYLRDLVNPYRYRETWKLPPRTTAARLSSESHSFSRIFSGAFYEILVGIYEVKRKANANLAPDAALVQASDDAGRMMAHALLLAPPGDAVFRVIATALFKADQQRFGGKYFDLLRRIFSERRILLVKDADIFKPHTKTIGAKTTSVSTGLLTVADNTVESMPPEALKKALRLRGEELVFARELGRIDDERVVQYRAQRMITLKGKEFGPANGAWVPVQGGLTLNVNPRGMVAFSGYYRAGTDDVRAIRDHVEKLAQRNRIYDACPGDDVDLMHLITRQQPYFIDYDEAGNKVVRRAFISCECAGQPK